MTGIERSVTVPFHQDEHGLYLRRIDIEDNLDGAGTFYKRFQHRFKPDHLHDKFYLIVNDQDVRE